MKIYFLFHSTISAISETIQSSHKPYKRLLWVDWFALLAPEGHKQLIYFNLSLRLCLFPEIYKIVIINVLKNFLLFLFFFFSRNASLQCPLFSIEICSLFLGVGKVWSGKSSWRLFHRFMKYQRWIVLPKPRRRWMRALGNPKERACICEEN